MNMRAQQRRYQAHRSTLAGVAGVGLMALGIVLTLTHVAGNVVPTVLALLGLVLLVIGIALGTLLVFDNFRFSRNQSYYDPDEEDD